MSITVAEILSHWTYNFPETAMSANDFYTKAEQQLKSFGMPETEIRRVNNKEGGWMSASREYLRVQHKNLVFDICAAPFGKDFFISWWLFEKEGTWVSLLKNTKAGDFLMERNAKRTFYQADLEIMFRNSVHHCLVTMIETMQKETGGRDLTTEEKMIRDGGM
jgi:hypothetical protein